MRSNREDGVRQGRNKFNAKFIVNIGVFLYT